MKNKIYNLSVTAIKLGLPMNWLKEKAHSKEIPCLKIGDDIFFNLEAVNKALLDLATKGDKNEC